MPEYDDILRLRVVFKNGNEQKVLIRCENSTEFWDQIRENAFKMNSIHGPRNVQVQGFWIRMDEVQYMEPIPSY